jgi:RHS repeat-associated protein
MTDTLGNVVWTARLDAYGKVTTETGTVVNNLRFPGQYHDRETGLYYNWHRYYSPELGRYITSDPIGLAGGLNTYAYVGGNPVNLSDPDGLRPEGNKYSCKVVCYGGWGLTPFAFCQYTELNDCGEWETTGGDWLFWPKESNAGTRPFNFFGIFSCDEFNYIDDYAPKPFGPGVENSPLLPPGPNGFNPFEA